METPAPDLSGLVKSDSTPAGDSPPAANLSASEKELQSRRQRSDAGKPRGPRGEKSNAGVSALSQAAFAKLYDPEIWARALSAPADALAATTGRKIWEISPVERQHLGATGAIAAQVYAVTDPRGLALALALITVLDIYGVRAIAHWAEIKKEREAAKKNATKTV